MSTPMPFQQFIRCSCRIRDPNSGETTSSTSSYYSSSSSSSSQHRDPQSCHSLHPKDYRGLSDRMDGLFVGPMPVKSFLSKFMKRKTGRPDLVFSTLSPNDMPTPFLQTVKRLTSSLHAFYTQNIPDDTTGFSPTISLYTKSSIGVGGQATLGTDYSQMELFVCSYPNEEDDPFSDDGTGPDYPFESGEHRTIRGHIIASAAAMTALQYRTHTFSVALFGQSARLMRWDPSGVVVSESFSFPKTQFLLEFFWRLNWMTEAERGRDPTVERISERWPTLLAPSGILDTLASQDNGSDDDAQRHRYFCRMKIPSRSDPKRESDVIISFPPKYSLDPPHGRATRPLQAYDIESRRIVFVKQTWRAITPGSEVPKEGDVYSVLEQKRVRNIAKFGAGNDVRNFTTLTQDYKHGRTVKWAYPTKKLIKYRLYRMTLRTIGERLSRFRSTKELVRAIRDAMICHDDAYFQAGILHRDISVGNIMIDQVTRKGFLIDWELSVDVRKPRKGSGITRQGTWEFMSSMILRYPKTLQDIADDRESVVYVLIWVALNHMPHEMDPSEQEYCSYERMFDEAQEPPHSDQLPTGGTRKLVSLSDATFAKDAGFTVANDRHVADLITTLQRGFSVRYIGSGSTNPARVEAYKKATAPLSNPGWLVDILNDALKSPTWTEKKDLSLSCAHISSPKRTSEDAGLDVANTRTKAQKLTANSSPRNRRLEGMRSLDA